MANRRHDTQSDHGVSLTEARAWELFAKSVPVAGSPTHTNEHLAQECFKAAALFEAVAAQQKETKG